MGQQQLVAFVFGLALGATACGSTPTAPASAPRAASGLASVSGTIGGLQSGIPVAGATLTLTVSFDGSTQRTVSASDGGFSLASIPSEPVQVSIDAPGYLTRQVWWLPTTAHAGLAIDMIGTAAPFSLAFYRQFARNGYDAPNTLQGLKRWTRDPSFYINTRLANGDDAPANMILAIARMITNSVPELTGGRLHVAAIELGQTSRALQSGWINLQFVAPGTLGATTRGNSSVGTDPGVINVVYDTGLEAVYQSDFKFHCEGAIVEIAEHELVHAMGYYHTDDSRDFQSGVGCPGVGRSSRATYHAAIVYSRPVGNADPDSDKAINVLASTAGSTPMVISCPWPMR